MLLLNTNLTITHKIITNSIKNFGVIEHLYIALKAASLMHKLNEKGPCIYFAQQRACLADLCKSPNTFKLPVYKFLTRSLFSYKKDHNFQWLLNCPTVFLSPVAYFGSEKSHFFCLHLVYLTYSQCLLSSLVTLFGCKSLIFRLSSKCQCYESKIYSAFIFKRVFGFIICYLN